MMQAPRSTNRPRSIIRNDWFKIIHYLESESDNIKVSICASCGFAKVRDKNDKVYMISRHQTLETAKIIVESVKKINAGNY